MNAKCQKPALRQCNDSFAFTRDAQSLVTTKFQWKWLFVEQYFTAEIKPEVGNN